MTRFLCIVFWLLSALAAITSAFLLGYFGWAAIVFWTVLVLPCTLYQRRQVDGQWPSPTMLRLWGIAITLSVLGGIVPPFFSILTLSDAVATIVAWILMIPMIYGGLVASLAVLFWVTWTGIRHVAAHQPRAA